MRSRTLVNEFKEVLSLIPLEGERKYNSGINPRSRSEGKDYETEISLNEEKLGSDDLTLSSIR